LPPLGPGIGIDADQPIDPDPVGEGALGERDPLVVIRDAGANDLDARRLEGVEGRLLFNEGLLVGLVDEAGTDDRWHLARKRRHCDGRH
jgi:hypothetical protein